MWHTLNEALNKPSKSNSSINLSPDNFNDYFSSIGNKVSELFSGNEHNITCSNSTIRNESFTFSPISEQTVNQLLKRLGSTKCNLDVLNMDSCLLCLSLDVIANSLAFLFNLSCSQNEIPGDWKLARVSPVFKNKGDRNDVSNYRPISVLAHVAKLLETCIKKQFVEFLEFLNTNNIITPCQSAYLANHSTITALHKMVDDWSDNINNGSITAACFLDLTKCFDTVNHSILLSKLRSYGCSDSVINWFKSYLANRQQIVRCNSSLSKIHTINIGVPQGSILGPILFIIFINDLPSCLKYSSCCIYADDISLYIASDSLVESESRIQYDLINIDKWFHRNKLLINTNKSHCMLIGTNANVDQKILSIKLNDTQLQQVSTFKLLGIYVDSSLSWRSHLEHLTKKLAPKVGLLCRLSKILPQNYLVTVYQTIIQPHIDYGISIWGGSPTSYILPIQRLQNRSVRAITRSFDWKTSVSGLLNNLKIMNLRQRYNYFISTLMYKCLNGKSPSYLANLFKSVSSIHNRDTRQSSNNSLYLPKPNVESFRRSLKYAGANLWNNLPQTVRNVSSLELFKATYKNRILFNSH